MRVLISAGEASGEMYGAQLIEALRVEFRVARGSDIPGTDALTRPSELSSASAGASPGLEFFGVGGDNMRAAGCDIVVDARDLAVVGITEILGHLPKIWRLFHRLIEEADRKKPDLAIVIDSPAFNWRVAREMKKRGIPVVYYVCPQFWAWRQGRVRLLRKYVDKALVIFPFEEKFYRDRGVAAEFVGHPLAELDRPSLTRDAYAAKYGLVASKPWITLMPGSRAKEVRMNLPEMLRATELLGADYNFLIPVARTIPKSLILDQMKESDPNAPPISLVPEALPALAHSRAGIIASGTATVEAAMMETPFVMVYRVAPLTYWLGRSTVKVPYFAMVNLIAGDRVVPELVQQDFTAEAIIKELQRVLADGPERDRMLDGLGKVRTTLLGTDRPSGKAAARAAKAIAAMKFKSASTVQA